MSELVHRRRGVAVVAGGIIVALFLAGCAPQVASPIGQWRAVGEDTGTLTVNEDGSFALSGASFNPIDDRDADGDFSGYGTWDAYPDRPEIVLRFSGASQGDRRVQPSSPSADFRSGVMRFTDPDETVGIEFRIEDPAE